MTTETYYCPNCGTQARMNAEHPDFKDGKPTKCQSCGSEEIYHGTQEEYEGQEDNKDQDLSFQEELEEVEGIGPSRAEEVTAEYSSWEELNKAIYSDEDTGLRQKTEELVKAHLEK